MKKSILSLAAVTSIMAVSTVTVSAEEITVNKGDTLWGIAQKNGVSVDHIKQLNSLSSNLIHPYDVLQVSKSNNQSTSNGTHTVKSGDTLWSISQEHGTSVQALKSANGLNSNLIFPGQQLSVDGSVATQTTNQSNNETTNQSTNEAQAQTSEPAPAPQESSQDEAVKTLTMEATAYTAFCEGCSGVTYTGIDLRANPNKKVIAVDPDVIPLGTEVYVEGYGKAVAGDIGGAIDGNRIDVFIADRSEALEFGRQSVQVKILD